MDGVDERLAPQGHGCGHAMHEGGDMGLSAPLQGRRQRRKRPQGGRLSVGHTPLSPPDARSATSPQRWHDPLTTPFSPLAPYRLHAHLNLQPAPQRLATAWAAACAPSASPHVLVGRGSMTVTVHVASLPSPLPPAARSPAATSWAAACGTASAPRAPGTWTASC